MQLSSRGRQMSRLSGIRSIMEDIAAAGRDGSDSEWLNLSPGNPSHIPEVVDAWSRLVQEALDDRFIESSTRYGPSRGAPGLVDAIVEYFNLTYGWSIGPENVVVGPGSQMLSFIATTLFTGPDADGVVRPLVLPRLPDYTGYQGLSLDPGGIVGLEPLIVPEGRHSFHYAVDTEALAQQSRIGMMLLSNPANPTGSSIDAGELKALIETAERHDVPLVVDHAYGEPFPGVVQTRLAPVLHSHVLNLFTLSKAGLPGERIAFAIGPAELIDPMISFLANSTLHAPQLLQAAVERSLTTRQIDTLTTRHIKPYYKSKRAMAEELLTETLPDSLDWRLHSCDGGMFCWLSIDHDWFDDLELYELLKRKRMFIVPGRHFFVEPLTTPFLSTHGRRCIRLSLSPDEWAVAEGVNRLGEALEEMRVSARTGK
ncbi:valine--pyruvate aminotransferase [Streptomyces sp. NBRC 110611]|uniref:aminotransferase class I/II-fold pyridoxal phosphate-dependent enzyme n=1 Tax=Streptomyces sp. NBRC 110611 TaxID=1621259 RepID=UPI0008562126|nr:aminotransferase class I/II-fold pyridoxal phosphate-dependent enzyme [Streptomyces sp. NBRC 110611]GAU68754.1 valine--pyruvate aminotransferase [Streptomyces sp. NBRC 110611]